MPPILYLIDGHALAYRTYFALTGAGGGDRWRTRSGEPTAGIYGFATVLLRLLEQDKPEYLAVAFDTGKTFRDEIFPEYKGTRAKMPDDLRPQIERIRQMIDAFHFPRLEMEGFEADDVLGSIAREAVEKGLGVKIITGDRDLLQLVDDRIIVNLAGSKLSEAKDFTPTDVKAYLGVMPSQVVDYKAMVGDTSDNIPGVPGVGVKTALSLLEQYETLDNIYAHIEEIPNRVRTRLEAGKDSAYMSRDLATIRTDLKMTLDLEVARTDHINVADVETLFHDLEFRSLMDRVRSFNKNISAPLSNQQQMNLFEVDHVRVGTPPAYQLQVHIVNDEESLQTLCKDLQTAPIIAFDTETTSTDPLLADLVGISIAVREGEGYYIPLGHKTNEPQLPTKKVIEALRPYFIDPQKEKIGQNLKYDGLMLTQYGLQPSSYDFDTMIAEWVIDPASHNLGLKEMADMYLAIHMTHIEELIGKGKNQITMDKVAIEQAAPYAAADAEVTLRLRPILQKKLDQLNSTSVFNEIEMPLIAVLAEMERTGISLDVTFLAKMSVELNNRMVQIERDIIGAVGYPFNLNSTQQLSKALFESLKLSPPNRKKRTASGHYSTAADVLEEMAGQHPVIEWILEFRELAKLKSTYVDSLPSQVNPKTGRVHTSFNQTGSVTGRLASSNPNLQNIPTRTDLGRLVRNAFVASPGMTLLSVDYSQIELRIVAHMSGDETMLEAFRAGQDIHATTAAAIYNTPLDQVTKEQRRHAKAINFGLIYGMSSFGLSRTTELTLGEAEDFVKAYFARFPGVKAYLDDIRRVATQQGYVETMLGRRRYFPNLRGQTNANLRNREEREAINAPIQGTAADIMKLAMIKLPPALQAARLSSRILLQVHDELLLECPREELNSAVDIVREVMENAYPLSIPLLTEARSGQNWGELSPYSG